MKFLNRFMQIFSSEPEKRSVPDTKTPGYKVELRPQSEPFHKPPEDKQEIVMELGDFLHRIPSHLLLSGPHDLKAKLRFGTRYLSERIASGETMIPLSEIYGRIPTIFRGQIRASDNIEIRFPWKKIAQRLVNSMENAGQGADMDADELIAKLRSKMPRKKKRAAGAGQTPEPAQSAQQSTAPVLPGRSQNTAWFSKTTLDTAAAKPVEFTPALSPKLPARPQPPPPATPAPMQPQLQPAAPAVQPKVTAQPEPAAEKADAKKTEPGGRDSNTPAMLTLQPSTPVPAEKRESEPSKTETVPSKPEDDLKITELPADLQRKIARFKGQYERRIGELERICRNNSAELDRLHTELKKTSDALAEEQTATSVSRELILKAQADRDRAQEELASLRSRMAALQESSRVAELTAERDALLQQRTHLSAQVAELSKRGGQAQSKPGEGNGHSHGTTRQIEELQRRIALMETTQRESALELSREKEARSKAEKMLAAADKLQEQSANYMETAKTEMRREIEASVKLREIEFKKTQKELQDQVASLSDQVRLAATELENARNRIMELEAAPPKTAAPESAMQAHLIAQLEDDIETYRNRLKTLIAERDAAREEAKKAKNEAASNSPDSADEIAGLRKLHSQQAAEIEKLKRQCVEAETRLESERATFESRCDSLRQALDAARETHAAQIAAIHKEHAGGANAAISQAQEQAAASAKLAEDRTARISELEAEITALRERLNEESTRHADEIIAASREREAAEMERGKTLAALREQSVSLEQQLSAISAERDQLRSELAKLTDTLRTTTAAHDELLSTLDQEHTAVVQANETLTRRIATLEEQGRAESAALESRLADATRQRDEALSLFKTERDRATALDHELQILREEAAALRKEVESLASSKDGHENIRAERDSHAAHIKRIETALADEREARSLDASAASETVRTLRAQLDETVSELTSLRSRHEDELAALRAEIATIARHRDELLRHIARTTEEQRHILDDARKPADDDGDKPDNVIDVGIPELLPPAPANNLNIPPARPAPVPPPRVNRG